MTHMPFENLAQRRVGGQSAPQSASQSGARHGFTLVELLVVIAIVALVIAILLPVLGRMRAAARTTTCLTSQRSIANAMNQYAADNAARLPSPRTDKAISGVAHCWVNASGANLQNLPDGTKIETQKALEGGVLWSYMDQNPLAYKSPLDPTQRLRSYSINSYVGNISCPDDFGCGTLVPLPAGQTSLPTSTLSKLPQPANTMCSINEESPLGYNEEGWLLDWSVPFWEDIPAFWDSNRINMSFMDGSVKTMNILSPGFVAQASGPRDSPRAAI